MEVNIGRADKGGMMKLQLTWDNSPSFNHKELKRFTIEGQTPGDIEGIIREYVRPMLFAMQFLESTIDEYLGVVDE